MNVFLIHVTQIQNVSMVLIHILASARKDLMVMEFHVHLIWMINDDLSKKKTDLGDNMFFWSTMLNNTKSLLLLKHGSLENFSDII